MSKPVFAVGEVVHLWANNPYRIPVEAVVVKITATQITTREEDGTIRRFRERDHRELGYGRGTPSISKLDRDHAEQRRQSLALEAMKYSVFPNKHMALIDIQRWSIDMQRWSNDQQVLIALAREYRAFLRRAAAIGATVPKELLAWLQQEGVSDENELDCG